MPNGWGKNKEQYVWLTSKKAPNKIDLKTRQLEVLQMGLLVIGQQSVNQRLVFAINGFNPEYTYTLDFNNGYIQEGVGESSVYAYKESGIYKIGLWIQSPEGMERKIHQWIAISDEDEFFSEVEADSGQAVSMLPQNELLPPSPTSATVPVSNRKVVDTVFIIKRIPAVAVANHQALDPEIPPVSKEQLNRKNFTKVSSPLQVARRMPSFPGGEAALFRYIEKNLIYPQHALDKEVEGKIYVQFVVQPDGKLTDLRVMRGLGYGCDAEALRMIRNMPRWNPGLQNGQKVPVYYTLPITYEIN